MIFRHEHRDGVWVDLEQPSAEDIRAIAREFGVSERLEAELLAPTPFPLVADDGNVALLVLHFPAHGEADGQDLNQEVDFLVGKGFILTVRYEVIAPLHHLRKLLEAEELLSGHAPLAADVLLEVLFAHLYAAVRDHANHIKSHLERIEEEMFADGERHTVRAISSINREYLHLEAALAGQEEPLARFLKTLALRNFFGPSFSARSARILAERSQVERFVITHRAIAAELRQTNSALLEARQNQIMKTLTVMTVVVLPLELIAFVFGMNAEGTPFAHNPHAFSIIIGLMLATTLVMAGFFAKKRWLF